MQDVMLNSGYSMPMMIFGTSRIDKAEVKSSVIAAVRAGYTHIDTAAIYHNESLIGEALSELFASGEKKRSDLFITTKVFMSKYRNIKPALEHSLQRLQLDYVDLYLLHFPLAVKPEDSEPPKFITEIDRYPLHLAWAQMEDLVDSGLVRSIGVSNWTIALLIDMLAYSRIPPAVNQIEMNPYNKRKELISFCLQNSIVPTAYRVIYRPNGTFSNFLKCALDEPVVMELSQKYGCSTVNVLIAWCLQLGCGCIAKSQNEQRIIENFEGGKLRLEKEDAEKISRIADQGEYFDFEKLYKISIFK